MLLKFCTEVLGCSSKKNDKNSCMCGIFNSMHVWNPIATSNLYTAFQVS